jgi:hypothetical protein
MQSKKSFTLLGLLLCLLLLLITSCASTDAKRSVGGRRFNSELEKVDDTRRQAIAEEAARRLAETTAYLPPRTSLSSEKPDLVFNDIKQKVWHLYSVKSGNKYVRFIYNDQDADDSYTVQFRDEGINGRAKTNLFFAPYLTGAPEGGELAFQKITSTRNVEENPELALFTNDQFFACLHSVTHWGYAGGGIALYADETINLALYFIER